MALRAEKQVPNIYFGRPGSLVSFPWTKNDVSKTYERQTYDFLTGSGNHQVSQTVSGSRLYGLQWEALHYDNFAKLEQFYVGAMGSGPFVLVDPSVANLLPANAAAAGCLSRNIRGILTTGGTSNGTLSHQTDPAFVHRVGAPGSFRWLFTVTAATTPTLSFVPNFRGWWGIPSIPSQAYTFSVWARADGTIDSAIDLGLSITFRKVDGTTSTTTSSGNVTLTATWQRVTFTATAPSDGAYVHPSINALGSSITTGASIYLDEPQLEYGATVNDWAPATGVKPVQVMALADVVPFSAFMRRDVQLQLRELSV